MPGSVEPWRSEAWAWRDEVLGWFEAWGRGSLMPDTQEGNPKALSWAFPEDEGCFPSSAEALGVRGVKRLDVRLKAEKLGLVFQLAM